MTLSDYPCRNRFSFRNYINYLLPSLRFLSCYEKNEGPAFPVPGQFVGVEDCSNDIFVASRPENEMSPLLDLVPSEYALAVTKYTVCPRGVFAIMKSVIIEATF